MTSLILALLVQNVTKPPNGYSADRKWPLLVVLLGNGGSAAQHIAFYEFPEARNRFVVLAVSAKTRSWEGDDIPGVVEATDEVCKSHSIDPDNIWITGFSGGAMTAVHTALFRWPKYAGFVAHSNGATSFPPNLADLKGLYGYCRVGTNDAPQLKAAQDLKAKLDGFPNFKYEEVKGMGHTFTQADAKIGVAWIQSIIDKNAPRDPVKVKITFHGLERETLQDAASIVWNATMGLVQVDRFEQVAKGGDVRGPLEPAGVAKAILQSKFGVALDGTSLPDKEFEKLLKKLNASRPRKAPPAAPEAKISLKK